MIKILLTVAVFGSVVGFASFAMAQANQGESVSGDASALLAKLEAQCAHRRRTMPPDPRDGCDNKLRNDGHTGAGQGGASVSRSQTSEAQTIDPAEHEEGHQMAQAWADYLDDLRSGTNVVPIRKSA